MPIWSIPEGFLRAAVEHSPDGFMLFEAVRDEREQIVDFRWLYLNEAAAQIVGTSREAHLGQCMLDLYPGNLETGLFDLYRRVTSKGEAETRELDYRRDGLDYSFRVVASPVPNGFAVFFSDITMRRETEQDLLDADRHKDEFLAMLSHELRNPLAGVSYSLEVLGQRTDGSEAALRAHRTATRQADQLGRLIDDLLDVSRIERGVISFERVSTDLVAAVDVAVDGMRARFERAGVQLSTNVAPGPLLLMADGARLTQAVVNLLDNACRYSPTGSTVSLSLQVDGGDARVIVRDQGRGFDPAGGEALFEKFSRGGESPVGRGSGLGIGLFLVRRLAQAHGGSVTGRSDGCGKGAMFELTLPLCDSGQGVAPKPDDGPPEQGGVSETVDDPSGPWRILIVDDDEAALDSMAMLFESEGHEVVLAKDAWAAIDAARQHLPQVVLMDIGLPDLSGHELARQLRADQVTSSLTLIALSGFGQAADLAESRAAGVDEHLVKPVVFADLKAAIARCLAAR